MRIAVIRLSSFGDIITTIVFIKMLKSATSAHITWIVDSSFKELLENCKYIDEICDIALRKSKRKPSEILSIFKRLKSLERFDLVLDFQGLLKSAVIGKMLKSHAFIGFDKDGVREKIASIFYTKKVDIKYGEHVLKRQYGIICEALNFLGVSFQSEFELSMLDNRGDIIKSSKSAQDKLKEILKNFESNKKILFILEASKSEKEYGLKNFYDLALKIKHGFNQSNSIKIFLIWNDNEREIRELGEKDEVFCVLSHLNIDEIKALLSNMNLVVGGDTGITHLAWALRVPSITIFGNTPLSRVNLGGKSHISICNNDFGDTIKGDFSIREISSDKIASHALNLLNGK